MSSSLMDVGGRPELPRLLFVGGYPPSTDSGGGIILRNLLGGYPRERLAVITLGQELERLASREDRGGLLDVPHVGMRPWRLGFRGGWRLLRVPLLGRLLRWANAGKLILQTASLARRRASQGTVILSIPYNGEFGAELFAASYVAHRLSGAPLVVYEMDEWRASLGPDAGRIPRLLERVFHRRILRAARAVWAVSEPLAELLRLRGAAEAKVLPNCVDVDEFARARAGAVSERAGGRRVLYTGAVYGAQADAIRNVLRALEAERGVELSLVIYSNQPADSLAAYGVGGERLRVERAVGVESIPSVLAAADVLLLPFSFDEREREIVSTSLPTKTADYLAAGVPVLVHAPPYATIARLARAEGWGEVVDEPSVERLSEALRRLLTDEELRGRLAGNALRAARARHDLGAGRARFFASISEAAAGASPGPEN